MPVHLREQLHGAAARSGRSINAELVYRRERSLSREQRVLGRLRQRQGEGSMRRRTLRRWSIAAGVLASAMIVGLSALVLDGAAPAGPAVEAEMPNALAAHIADLRQAMPGNGGMSNDGPGGAAADAFDQRAYPDSTISLPDMERARDAFAASQGREAAVKLAATANWELVGPSRALYPSSPFLNSFLYVPNAYIAGGRTTSIAIGNTCTPGNCRLYITPAGGGIWRTQDGLAATPQWEYLGGPLGINSAGAVTIDPNDPGGNTIYAATTTALRGMSESCCVGVTRPVPGAAKWGLYKSTNGGATWNFIHNGSVNAADCTGSLNEFNNLATCSPRGVRSLALDPTNAEIVYAGSYARGIWRSSNGGATWVQIKPSLNAAVIQTRPNLAVTTLPNGNTRMYVYEGNAGQNASRLFRSDSVATGVPTFMNMTSAKVKDPGWAWYGICDPQCWYDSFVYTPKGHPDIVYAGGDYAYGETIANKRGVILSTDAGVSGTDMTFDGTDPLHPNGLHPDQHDIVTNPGNPFQFFETNDGGAMRSSGTFVNRSSWCTSPPNRGLNGPERERCEQMLSRIPAKLDGINDGLSTLQWR